VREERWCPSGMVRLSVAALLLGAPVAQPASGQTLHWGPRLGLTLSGIRYEDPATSNQMEVRSGLHLGGSVAKDLGGHFAASRSGQAGAALSGWRAVGRQADRAC
jgi:hypothetical protein